MKNKNVLLRFKFAFTGIKTAWKTERSFRTQSWLACGALGILLIFRPPALWWAIFFLIIGAVFAAELINTALEAMIDVSHPAAHPMIAKAKDCSAGAVLVLSFVAVAILFLFFYDRL